MHHVLVASPKDIAKVVICKQVFQADTRLSKHTDKEVLYLIPPTTLHSSVEVGIFGESGKIFLGCLALVAVVFDGELFQSPLYINAGVVPNVIKEGVELIAKQFPQSVVCHTLVEHGSHYVVDTGVLRQYDSYLAALRIKPTLSFGFLAGQFAIVGNDGNLITKV